ncbi:MAG: YhjD/YihY/BrkB family envelope integrity protein [Gaiellaceae bacterium]
MPEQLSGGELRDGLAKDGATAGVRGAAHSAREHVVHCVDRPRAWVESGNEASTRYTALSWRQHYCLIDGPLQSLLLTVYVFFAIVPAVLVAAEYMEHNPAALANHLVDRYHLSGSAAQGVENLFVGGKRHQFDSAAMAIVTVLIFGVGFGRVLQLVYGRAWGLHIREKLTDQIRFGLILLVLFSLISLFLVQTTEVDTHHHPPWANPAFAPVWVLVLFGFFIWAPRYVTHNRLGARDLVASSALTSLGIVSLMFVSTFAMAPWINFYYGTDYGGLGVMMALFFWLGLSASVIVFAASLSPVLAGRRIYLAHHDARPPHSHILRHRFHRRD